MWNPLAYALRQRRKRLLVLDREEQAKTIDNFAVDHEQEALMRLLANQIRLNSLAEFGGLPIEEFDSIMKTHDPLGWSPAAHMAYQAMLNSVKS
jgi:hypothetical protein